MTSLDPHGHLWEESRVDVSWATDKSPRIVPIWRCSKCRGFRTEEPFSGDSAAEDVMTPGLSCDESMLEEFLGT